MPLPSTADVLRDPALWQGAIDDLERRRAGDPATIERCRTLVDSGSFAALVDDVVAQRHQPAPPRRIELNRAGRSKKVVYQLQPADELLCRVLNRIVQAPLDAHISQHCHSFRRGRSAVTAFASLLRVPGVRDLASVHLDIANFFNSIDVEDLVRTLPGELRSDPVLMTYITRILRDRRVVSNGKLLLDARKGAMAGTPLAPLLTNLYLRALDDAVASLDVAYARYSDDMLVLGNPGAVATAEHMIRTLLAERGLRINESKSRRGAGGEPWEFLGLRHHAGHIGLSANTTRKLRARVRRRARRLQRYRLASGCSPETVCTLFASSINRSLYGVRSRGDVDFSWARWFFPLLSEPAQLAQLDTYVQREMRWAATGSRRDSARGSIPYSVLRDAGYVPLVTAYHASRRTGGFTQLLAARTAPGDGVTRAAS